MRDGEHRLSGDRWTEAIEEIAACSAKSRPQQVQSLYGCFEAFRCDILYLLQVEMLRMAFLLSNSSLIPLVPS